MSKLHKISFYTLNYLQYLIPKKLYEASLNKNLRLLKTEKYRYLEKRINYYNKINSIVNLENSSSTYNNYKLKGNRSSYYFDLRVYLKYFDKRLSFSYVFGDNITNHDYPSFVKSRSIDDSKNCILMKLNKARHFRLVKDKINFIDKKNGAVFRGACHQKHRKDFIENCYKLKLLDIGDTRPASGKNPYHKKFMSIKNQLKYKFIISIEGNDVATNLKWILNSNSLCFMVKPKYETWLMEGLLIPDYHYVLLKDDYSDLDEKIKYYSQNTKQALAIIENANIWMEQFKNKKVEKLTSLGVVNKYFKYVK